VLLFVFFKLALLLRFALEAHALFPLSFFIVNVFAGADATWRRRSGGVCQSHNTADDPRAQQEK
jgi:hypothetical protein